MTDGDCKIRSNWNMAVCKHAYGEVREGPFDKGCEGNFFHKLTGPLNPVNIQEEPVGR